MRKINFYTFKKVEESFKFEKKICIKFNIKFFKTKNNFIFIKKNKITESLFEKTTILENYFYNFYIFYECQGSDFVIVRFIKKY